MNKFAWFALGSAVTVVGIGIAALISDGSSGSGGSSEFADSIEHTDDTENKDETYPQVDKDKLIFSHTDIAKSNADIPK